MKQITIRVIGRRRERRYIARFPCNSMAPVVNVANLYRRMNNEADEKLRETLQTLS